MDRLTTLLVTTSLLLPGVAAAQGLENCPTNAPGWASGLPMFGAGGCLGAYVDMGDPGINWLAPLDWNGDGLIDVVTGSQADFPLGVWTEVPPTVHLGSPEIPSEVTAAPLFSVDAGWWAGGAGLLTQVLGDVDGNGTDEVVFATISNYGSTYCGPGTAGLYSHEGLISSFSNGSGYLGLSYYSIPGDVNGDGLDDIRVGTNVYLGEPGFDLDTALSRPFPGQTTSINLGDLDGDGLQDLGDAGTPARWLAGSTDPDFQSWMELAVDGIPTRAGDLDGDGYDDVLVVAGAVGVPDQIPTVHYGGSEGLEPEGEQLYEVGLGPGWGTVWVADANKDGFDDLLFRGHLFLGTPDGVSPTPTTVVPSASARLVPDMNGDGAADLLGSSSASLNGRARFSVWFAPGAPCSDDLDCDGVPDVDDCAPYAGFTWPGNTEVCDRWDNDCDGLVDNGFDADGDGWTQCNYDCDDDDPDRHPEAQEDCNDIDDDCDGLIDEDACPPVEPDEPPDEEDDAAPCGAAPESGDDGATETAASGLGEPCAPDRADGCSGCSQGASPRPHLALLVLLGLQAPRRRLRTRLVTGADCQ